MAGSFGHNWKPISLRHQQLQANEDFQRQYLTSGTPGARHSSSPSGGEGNTLSSGTVITSTTLMTTILLNDHTNSCSRHRISSFGISESKDGPIYTVFITSEALNSHTKTDVSNLRGLLDSASRIVEFAKKYAHVHDMGSRYHHREIAPDPQMGLGSTTERSTSLKDHIKASPSQPWITMNSPTI